VFLKLFFEVGTTFISRNTSADHFTLFPLQSKFVILSLILMPVYFYFKMELIN
jgi:hypothetical protein